MKVYGYTRVSTMRQSIKRQIANIKAIYPDAKIVTDKYTGRKLDRPGWVKLYKTVKAGDVIVFDEVSRMSRDAAEGFETYKELFNRGVTLKFIKEPQMDTDIFKAAMEKRIDAIKSGNEIYDKCIGSIIEAFNQLLMDLAERQIKLAFEQSQKEVDFLSQRTREGLREVKERNARIEAGDEDGEIKQVGNNKGVKLTTKKSIAAKARIRELSSDFEGTLEDTDVIKLVGVSRNTYYKYKREMREGV